MNKQDFLKLLKSKKHLYAYTKFTDDDGGYVKQIKSEWIKIVSESSDDISYDVSETDLSIYLN